MLGAFLYRGKEPRVIKDDDRTFLVAFPGYDVRQVPATRSDGIINAAKYKKNYAHKSMDMGQQQLFKKTLSNHLDEVMGLLEGQFDKTFLALWPGFHYKRRAVYIEPEELVK